MTDASRSVLFQGIIATCFALTTGVAGAQGARPINPTSAAVFEYWTPERRATATPRNLIVDSRGSGSLRLSDGTLVPHGHDVAAQSPGRTEPRATSIGDTTGPTISGMDPSGANAIIGSTYTFKATVTDASSVRSVTFKVQKFGGTVQVFSATKSANDVWSVALQGFTDGDWNWQVVAKDNAARGGNTSTTEWVAFTVAAGGGGGSGGTGTVNNAEWTAEGPVQSAAGRLYFEMPPNAKRKGPWTGYVCSGTVATDGINGRSVILTAAHCVYDDANKAFARNVIFIPDQTDTTGTGTDRDCSNDPMGCWSPSFGVVDVNYTATIFPNNNAWDYAFYVVNDTGAHTGYTSGVIDALDRAAGSLGLSFSEPAHDTNDSSDFTSALGYSYDADPNFMYCAQHMTTINGTINWWLPSCGLTGGSSGGPWVQPMSGGNGPIISVNSWGYTNSPGMAGPKFYQTSTYCVFGAATTTSFASILGGDGNAGVAVSCP